MIHEFLRHPFDDAEVALADASHALRAAFTLIRPAPASAVHVANTT